MNGESTMNLQPQSDSINPHYQECLNLHKCWLWFLALGIALIVLGVLAIGAAFITTLATVIVFGSLLIAGGVVQIVNAFLARAWRGFFVHLLAGMLHLLLGVLIIEYPGRAAEFFTLLLALAFLVGGCIRIVVALAERFPDWGWVLVNGIITAALGIAIWRRLPEASFLVIGIFVGIDLLFNGWSWVMLALIVKTPAPESHVPAPGASKSAPAATA
jgi:uncharacterized membrane protein HdeD (DUF308 family)